MIVFGGFSHGIRTNELYSLNLNTLNWKQIQTTPKRPEIRSGHSAIIYSNYLYIYGGISDEGEKLNDFWRFNLIDNY